MCFNSICNALNKLSEYIHTFTYQKTLIHALLLLVFKIFESLKYIFKIFRSGLVYKYKRGGCNVTYYSKTNCHLKARICGHVVTSYLTEKKVKTDNNKFTGIQIK